MTWRQKKALGTLGYFEKQKGASQGCQSWNMVHFVPWVGIPLELGAMEMKDAMKADWGTNEQVEEWKLVTVTVEKWVFPNRLPGRVVG